MIELRWLEKLVLCKNDPKCAEVSKVLQYRYRNIGEGANNKQWPEWIDVPTVDES